MGFGKWLEGTYKHLEMNEVRSRKHATLAKYCTTCWLSVLDMFKSSWKLWHKFGPKSKFRLWREIAFRSLNHVWNWHLLLSSGAGGGCRLLTFRWLTFVKWQIAMLYTVATDDSMNIRPIKTAACVAVMLVHINRLRAMSEGNGLCIPPQFVCNVWKHRVQATPGKCTTLVQLYQ